jgi:hypothetical protein
MANTSIPEQSREATAIRRAVVRMHVGVLTVTCAVLGGLGLFIMTAWLLIKGGPQVGLHLRLLGHYFIGYSVTWPGSIVGFFYGALLGGLVGWAIGRIYNGVVTLRQWQ